MVNKSKRRKHASREYFALNGTEAEYESSGAESEGDTMFDSDDDRKDGAGPGPGPGSRRVFARRASSWDGCCRFLFILSVAGIIFMSIITYMLAQDNIYLKIGDHVPQSKPELARGCFGAVILYIITAFLSFSPAKTHALMTQGTKQLRRLKRRDDA